MISASSVANLFKLNNISSVAIIDDAFDPPERSLPPSLAAMVYQATQVDPNLARAFEDAGHPLNTVDDLTTAAVAAVKARASGDPTAGEAWDQIKVQAKSRSTALDGLAKDLRSDLKVKVKKIAASAVAGLPGKDAKPVVEDTVDIVFLDYELEEGEGEGFLSAQITDRIYNQFASKTRAPLVILMSTKKLAEADVVAFQRKTKVLSGMFYFVPKDDLFDKEKRHYRLAAFAKSLSTGQVLQRFVSGLERTLEAVRVKVFSDVRSLSIGDHAFLQKLRLHEDGQPLGEYLLWLANAHLTKELLVSPNVRASEAEVNALTFDHLPPTQSEPSINLATLYSSAVMRPVAPLPEEQTNQATHLQFGDLFRRPGGKQVWLCITAPCDLAFSETRPVRTRRSILFLPGELRLIGQGMTAFEQRQPRTELVWVDDRAHRILWNTKEVARADWGKIHAWKVQTRVERIARLSTPFALEIQRSFATDLTRIGMPSPPPFYNPVKVRLVVLDQDDRELELTDSLRCAGYLSGDGRANHLVLGDGIMNALPEMLRKGEEALGARFDAIERKRRALKMEPGDVENARTARDKLAAARKDAVVLSGLKGPFLLPGTDAMALELEELLAISEHGSPIRAAGHVPLRLTVLRPEEADAG